MNWHSNHHLLAISLALALLPFAGRADISVSISAPEVAPGGRTIASITLDQASGFAGAEFVITLPAFVAAGEAQVTPGNEFQVVSRSQPGRLAVALANGQAFSRESATILQIPLNVANTAPAGDYSLAFESVRFCDAEPKWVAAQAVPGTLRVLEPPADLDQDGLPDEWEMRFFGTTAGSPDADFDEDGLSDAKEFLVRSDPCSPDSVFRIQNVEEVIETGSRKVLLEWEGDESRRYDIYWSDGPVSENMVWQKVYNPSLRRAGSLWFWTDDGTRTHADVDTLPERYYRVVLVE
ncbi:MAG: hypothetical protein AB9869_32730 [Verrucomicrobiia bacterium]